jgi:hypothetical protein
LIIAGVNAYNLWNEHWAHWAHMEPLEERPEYPYQNIRTKNFFWGDGDKVNIFTTLSKMAVTNLVADLVVSNGLPRMKIPNPDSDH